MKCVKCDGELRRVDVDDVEVDQCDACYGIWFDSGELRRILGKKNVDELRGLPGNNKADDAKRASCPRCKGQGKLVQVVSLTSELHIDTCSVCGGQWLDGGELEILRGGGAFAAVGAFFKRFLG